MFVSLHRSGLTRPVSVIKEIYLNSINKRLFSSSKEQWIMLLALRRRSLCIQVQRRSISVVPNCRNTESPTQCSCVLDDGIPETSSRGIHMKFADYNALLSIKSLRGGQIVQAHMIKARYLPSQFLWHRLISFYVNCEAMDDARMVFDEMPERNVVSWTTVISGYSRYQFYSEALALFIQMRRSGIDPNEYTFATVLASSVGASVFYFGMQIHGLVTKTAFESNLYVGCSLLDLYAKSSRILEAQQVFNALPSRDIVCYTSIISGYAQLGHDKEALKLFLALHAEGMNSNYVTYTSVLTALSGLAAYEYGRQVHGHALRFIRFHVVLENALIDMYSKCGNLTYARKIFDAMPERTVVSWNTILAAYSKHGHGKALVALYNTMKVDSDGPEPDSTTLLTVLSGCSHGGMETTGLELFDEMTVKYKPHLGIEHFGCVVDILSRGGQLERALQFIQKMPVEPNAAIWSSLLGACVVHGNTSVGKVAGDKVIELEPDVAGHYIEICNLYSSDGKWDQVRKVRQIMKDKGVIKKPGRSFGH